MAAYIVWRSLIRGARAIYLRRMRPYPAAALVLTLALEIADLPIVPQEPSGAASAAAPAKRVLILASFDPLLIGTRNKLEGISSVFASSGLSPDTAIRFMDLKRIKATRAYLDAFREMLSIGYAGQVFDAVLACDNDAFQFMRSYRDGLFPGVPLVFVSINNYDPTMLDGRADLTGTSESTDYVGTVDLALELFPRARRVVAVVDGTTTGLAHRLALGKIEGRFAGRAVFSYLSLADYTLQGLGDRLAALGKDAAVLLLQSFQDRDGKSWPVERSTPYLVERSSAPCFVVTDTRLGFGAVGGHVVSGKNQGAQAAELAVRILRGESPLSVPVRTESNNAYIFEWKALRRFGIGEGRLPPGSVVLGRPPTFLEQYRDIAIALAVAFGLLVLFIAILSAEVLRRRKIERMLVESRNTLGKVMDSVPQAIFWKDRDSIYLGCNAVFAESAGLPSAQAVVGMSDFDLAKSAADAEAYRAGDREVLGGTPKGRFTEEVTRVDGRRIVVEVVKAPLLDEEGKVRGVLGIIEDVTQRGLDEAKLRDALAEKETLLRELYHRTKNNMNVISSMLWIQEARDPESPANPVLEDMRGRIASMAMVHERLYASKNLSSLDLGAYLGDLVVSIEENFDIEGRVSVDLDLDAIPALIDVAVPCGLVVNELVCNSFKYAFSSGRGGRLAVSAKRLDGETIAIRVEDDGPGLPEGFDPRRDGKLGLQTVLSIAEHQLGGRVDFPESRGFACVVAVRDDLYSERV
jgi:two-component system, cell cycle sensor histidine kinase and response regulator CckA